MSVKIEKKIKGYTVIKPGEEKQAPVNIVVNDHDRRLKLDKVQVPLADSLRWEHRPHLTEGNPAHVFQVLGPEHKFFVIVSYVRNGSPDTGYPFEVFVAGHAPRGLNALAKSLSLDMRSRDRAWLKAKLESIAKTTGKAFDFRMPNGIVINIPSEVAAFARLVHFQCEQLGAFSDDAMKETPLMNALMSSRRPKTTAAGSLAWYCDVENPNTGDKFKVFVPELELPDGSKRPYEVWFDGVYPNQSFSGLAKCLSLDMQVNDPDWVARKLRQLSTLEEMQGEFWAPVPGSDKSTVYPSTLAYVATLILSRYQTLGILEAGGYSKTSNVITIKRNESTQEPVEGPIGQLDCPECGGRQTMAVTGGCPICTACSYSRCG